MSEVSELIASVQPPEAPAVGLVAQARSIVEQYMIYPSEYWDLLATYGYGWFYGDLDGVQLLSPTVPDFALQVAIDHNAVNDASPRALADLGDGQRWLPVGHFGDVWVLLVEEGAGPIERVVLVCTRSTEEFIVLDSGLAHAVQRIGKGGVFSSLDSESADSGFSVARFQLEMDWDYLASEVADSQLAFLPALAEQLRELCTLDLERRSY